MERLEILRQHQLERRKEEEILEQHFIELWNKGLTYKQISEEIGVKFSKVVSIGRRLQVQSKIEPRLETRYAIDGKLETPMTEEEFAEGMKNGHFVTTQHRAYCILLYYSAIRKTEGIKPLRDQFKLTPTHIMFDVGERLKHSKRTPALPIPLDAPFVGELEDAIVQTPKGKRVFAFSKRTAYNAVRRAFKYPHYFRLSRITWFFMPHPEIGRPQGFSIAEVHSWTGLSLKALDYYLGLVSVSKMGESLAQKR